MTKWWNTNLNITFSSFWKLDIIWLIKLSCYAMCVLHVSVQVCSLHMGRPEQTIRLRPLLLPYCFEIESQWTRAWLFQLVWLALELSRSACLYSRMPLSQVRTLLDKYGHYRSVHITGPGNHPSVSHDSLYHKQIIFKTPLKFPVAWIADSPTFIWFPVIIW